MQPKLITLRPYQDDAVFNLRQGISAGYKKQVLRASTGAGKTLISAFIIKSAVEKGNRVMFIVDSLELVDQAVAAFESIGLKVGVMQGQHHKTDSVHKCQVATAQTLHRRIEKNPAMWAEYPISLFIHDECHVTLKARNMLADLYPKAIHIGLTATPFAKGMGQFYENVIDVKPMQELIDEGYLLPFKVMAPSTPDMKGVKVNSKGDYDPKAAADKYDGVLVADMVDTWKKEAEGRSTIGFATNVLHSKFMTAQFQKAGINAVHIDGYGNSEEQNEYRQLVINDFKAGKIDVLWNVAIATKGFDAPICSCIIDAQPTKSLMRHFQKWGRAFRIHPGQTEALILDHAGNALRNGFPTHHDFEGLCDGKAKENKDRKAEDKEKPLPQPCPSCGAMKAPRQHKCSHCGFAPEKAPEGMEVVDGELALIKPPEPEEKYNKEYKQAYYSELLTLTHQRSKSPEKASRWAYALYCDRFDTAPKGLNNNFAAEVSSKVESFVTRSMKRYQENKNANRISKPVPTQMDRFTA